MAAAIKLDLLRLVEMLHLDSGIHLPACEDVRTLMVGAGTGTSTGILRIGDQRQRLRCLIRYNFFAAVHDLYAAI